MKSLHLSNASYYRHLAAVKDEDQLWMKELARGEFVSEYRRAWDSLEALQGRLIAIADTSKVEGVKIAAVRLCREIEMDRIALLAEGPTALAVRRRTPPELMENVEQV